MGALRKKETGTHYLRVQASEEFKNICALCKEQEVIVEFAYWRIIPNLFPYDRIARAHHMLTLKRHAPDDELTTEEKEEFTTVKNGDYIQNNYDIMIEPTSRKKSIPLHSHLHLIVLDE